MSDLPSNVDERMRLVRCVQQAPVEKAPAPMLWMRWTGVLLAVSSIGWVLYQWLVSPEKPVTTLAYEIGVWWLTANIIRVDVMFFAAIAEIKRLRGS